MYCGLAGTCGSPGISMVVDMFFMVVCKLRWIFSVRMGMYEMLGMYLLSFDFVCSSSSSSSFRIIFSCALMMTSSAYFIGNELILSKCLAFARMSAKKSGSELLIIVTTKATAVFQMTVFG